MSTARPTLDELGLEGIEEEQRVHLPGPGSKKNGALSESNLVATAKYRNLPEPGFGGNENVRPLGQPAAHPFVVEVSCDELLRRFENAAALDENVKAMTRDQLSAFLAVVLRKEPGTTRCYSRWPVPECGSAFAEAGRGVLVAVAFQPGHEGAELLARSVCRVLKIS